MWRTALTYSIAIFCILVGISIAAYKHYGLSFPIAPNTDINSWQVQMQTTLQSPDLRNNAGVEPTINVIYPSNNSRYAVVDLQSVARGFGEQIIKNASKNRDLQFTKRSPASTESISVRFMLYELEDSEPTEIKAKDVAEIFKSNNFSKEKRLFHADESENALYETIDGVVGDALNRSSSPSSFLSELWKILRSDNENKQYLMQAMQLQNEHELYVILAQVAGYPARIANGLLLKDEMVRSARLRQWVEILAKGQWRKFDVQNGDFIDAKTPLYRWWVGAESLVYANYFKQFVTSISIKPNTDSAISRALWQSEQTQPLAYRFAIQSLPLEQQMVLQILLLMPLGGLIVAFVRQVIGIRTFGTFMPVLIALALRETGLATGLMLFVGLTFIGLMMRGYLNTLRLLFVPRLAAVLCMVVALITIIMLIFKDSDFSVGVSVALFPVVIMTMFIERMSNMWEEKGAKGALIAFIGTMVMACIVYLIAVNDYVKHAMITFPELLLVVFGCCLILGRYNGYRLTEYLRFRQLKKSLRELQAKKG
jgi:hypothetical protein